MQRHVFASTEQLASELLHLTIDAAERAIAARGLFSMALTGGSAATSLYPVLAQAALPWERVHIFYGDERCVPPTHADSNHRLAVETLISKVRALPEQNVHRVLGELPPEEGARRYQQELLDVCGGSLDVVHVGMGPDGHVLSLFPGHRLLDEKALLVTHLTDSPKPPPARVTLTLPALAKARSVWFLVAGANKADAAGKALLDPSSTLPAALASRIVGPDVRWLLDAPAAAQLKAT